MSDEVSYKQKLEVLQQQQELIEDEAEQEQEEQEARKKDKEEKEEKEAEEAAKREQEEATKATEPAIPGAAEPVVMAAEKEDDARMTKEQLGELAEALSILTAKSSIVKERDELKAVLEDNILSEAVSRITLLLDPC